MGRIVQLSPQVVNKIAAGEVIERPAAVVKELVENSLDAGASMVEITVEQGGARRIRVTDDGHGIERDDLAIAFSSHATSKISDVEDLDAVATLGFRGEALPSIAAISHCRIRSRPANQELGAEVRCEGGQLSDVTPAGAQIGTTVDVENLFYNTPVRRKFLKSTATEVSHITQMVTRLALGHPEIGFRLSHDGRDILHVHSRPPGESNGLASRIGDLFGGEIQRDLIPVSHTSGWMTAEGFVLPINHTRRDSNNVFTFLNGRYLRDKVLLSSVGKAYRELLPGGRHPIVFLHLLVDPREVDVNVHPTKTEVRFRRSGEVHSFVSGAVAAAIRSSDASSPSLRVGSHGLGARIEAAASEAPVAIATAEAPAASTAAMPAAATPLLLDPALFVRPPPPPRGTGSGGSPPAPPAKAPDYRHAYQLHNAFLVEETAEGISIIDQHALHERILTERIRERVQSEGMAAQRLLAPIVVPLAAAEVERCLTLKGSLARFGIDFDRFGEDSVAVYSLPAMLAPKLQELEVRELMRSLLAEAGERELQDHEGRLDEARFLDRAIYSMACRAAVKIGDPLSNLEVQAILRMRDAIAGRHLTCPHGRPTTLTLSLAELRKRFER